MSDKDIIRSQQEKIDELETIIRSIAREPLSIGVVKNGPASVGDTTSYSVDIGGGNIKVLSLADSGLTSGMENIKIGDKVLCLAAGIVGVLPEELDSVEKVKIPLVKWSDIGGMKSQIENIRSIIELPLANSKQASEFGVKP